MVVFDPCTLQILLYYLYYLIISEDMTNLEII